MKEKELYYNEKQIEFLDIIGRAMIKVFKGGRGSGKTRCIPEDILDRAASLPRARIFMLSYSFEQLYRNVMPDLHEVFKLHGLVDGVDYVVDRKPPAHFDLPYKKLEDYKHSISLFNGFAVQCLSVARKAERNRGPSYDGGIIDEALLISQYQFDSIFYPTVRGYDHWDGSPYFKMVSIYSSQPRDAKGSWFLRYQELAKKYPTKYGWVEATALDNLVVLGEDYVDNQKSVLNYVDFQIEIMNKGKVTNLPDSFYYRFKEEQHTHEQDCYSPLEALEISLDFGGNYSCMTVSQERDGIEYFIREFDTNNMSEEDKQMGRVKKLPHIIEDFINHYKGHQHKLVKIWGERMGLSRTVTDDRNYFEQIQDQLHAAGWSTELLVTYNDSALHKSRWSFMNNCFEENIEDYPAIRIDARHCPNMIIAIQHTKITDEFKKNKRAETDPNFNQSHAPHLTDTLDYKIFNKYYYLLDDSFESSPVDSNIDSI